MAMGHGAGDRAAERVFEHGARSGVLRRFSM